MALTLEAWLTRRRSTFKPPLSGRTVRLGRTTPLSVRVAVVGAFAALALLWGADTFLDHRLERVVAEGAGDQVHMVILNKIEAGDQDPP